VVPTLPRPRRLPRWPRLEVGAGAADLPSVLRYGLALLSMAAAVVHFAVIQQHFIVYWLYGAFFIAVGLFQLAWALAVLIRPSRLLYLAGATANVLTAAAWVLTRTIGPLVGPDAGSPEKVGFGDVVSTIFEVLIVGGCLALAWRSRQGRTLRPSV